jgi:hypothetical protein
MKYGFTEGQLDNLIVLLSEIGTVEADRLADALDTLMEQGAGSSVVLQHDSAAGA